MLVLLRFLFVIVLKGEQYFGLRLIASKHFLNQSEFKMFYFALKRYQTETEFYTNILWAKATG